MPNLADGACDSGRAIMIAYAAAGVLLLNDPAGSFTGRQCSEPNTEKKMTGLFDGIFSYLNKMIET
jgi:hypothetical protein